MKRKIGMLLAVVLLTGFASTAGAVNVYTYCAGTCVFSGQSVVYKCGYGVGAPSCCARTRNNACPGDEFSGTCQDNYGNFFCG